MAGSIHNVFRSNVVINLITNSYAKNRYGLLNEKIDKRLLNRLQRKKKNYEWRLMYGRKRPF